MKKIQTHRYLIPLLAVLVAGCDDTITDFGFTGSLSGAIRDAAGNPVSGNVATPDFEVMALGEGETQPLTLRVKGDGTYANTEMYPQTYRVWIEGPVVSEATEASPVIVDLTGPPVTRDFTVTPFLTIGRPTAGQPAGNTVQVSYDITPSAGHAVQTGANRVLYTSTTSWPGSTTGSANLNHTIVTQLPSNSGTVTVSGLRPGRTYFVRVGARAVGSTRWNMSDQTSFVNP